MTYFVLCHGTIHSRGKHLKCFSVEWVYGERGLGAIVLSDHPALRSRRVFADFDLPSVNGRYMRVQVKGELVDDAGRTAIKVKGKNVEARRKGE